MATGKPGIQIKRAYEPASKDDGYRVLVDRVWPRGMRKEELHFAKWAKDVAPSTKLRQWFAHDPQRWREFQQRYKEELRDPAVRDELEELLQTAKGEKTITLLYGAKDEEHNQAVVLKSVLSRMLSSRR